MTAKKQITKGERNEFSLSQIISLAQLWVALGLHLICFLKHPEVLGQPCLGVNPIELQGLLLCMHRKDCIIKLVYTMTALAFCQLVAGEPQGDWTHPLPAIDKQAPFWSR